jgi:predicted ArsR family transcriptional regulator
MARMIKSTRDQVLELLRQHGDMTIAALAERLGIALPAVRRHLDILTSEGLVDYRTVRQHTGRPYFEYFLTDRARERAANGYPRLVERLLREVSALGEGEGQRLLETILERMSEHLVEEHRGQVTGSTLEERVASLVAALADEGIVDDFEVREDGVHLTNTLCPHRRAALASEGLCRSEQRAIAMLLDAPVEQVSRIADGKPRCEYIIHCLNADLALTANG